MTFKEFLFSISGQEFIRFLKNNKELSEKERNSFYNTFLYLKHLEPTESLNPFEILIFEHEGFFESTETVVECIRYKKQLDKIPENYEDLETFIDRYSFSFDNWAEVLSYKINEKSLEKMNHSLLIFLILEELMEFGTSEDEIDNCVNAIRELIKEAEKSISEGGYHIREDTRTEEEKQESHIKMSKTVEKVMNIYYEHLKK